MQASPQTYNTADPKQVRKAAIKEKMVDHRNVDDIFAVMSFKEGRRFMWRLINDLCHCDSTGYQNSGSLMYYSTGEANIGRIVKGEMKQASIKLYQLMEKENWDFLEGENSNGR